MEADMQLPPAPTEFVEKGDVQRLIYASGTIREDAGEEITPGVNAKVTSVLVTEGQQVKAGDMLFTLDETSVSLEYAKQKLNYETQLRDLQEEIQALQGSEVRSTESGTISKLLVESESEIKAGTVIAKISKNETFNIKAGFNGADIQYINEGQSARVFLQEFLSYLPGTVTRVDRRGQATPEGGLLYMVTVEIKNPGALREGGLANAEINTGDKTVHSIGLAKLNHLDEIDLKSERQGKINHINVKEGDEISAGELLATIDSQAQRSTLTEKRLTLEQAKLTMELKQKEYDKYQAKASVDGKIVELNVEAGKDLPLDKPAVVISEMTTLKMTVKVDEIDIPFVKVGQKADVYANAYGDRKFTAEVTRVAEKGK
ncbi:MAG: HlyD family efflux transporter periplasmic adaptor subunit [Bacillota bacterium]|nr:HlyD family efflux transporter periplasmic adaptor subunit [Bacillota bacterium]